MWYNVHVKRNFTGIIERDAEGWYVADVPALPGCHTQARSLDELRDRVREVIELCLEESADTEPAELVGVQQITIDTRPAEGEGA